MWATPILALLPLWGFMYMRATTENPPTLTGPMAEGAVVYNKCASCHGGGGEGGAGYPLNAGSVLRTFPSIEEQITFVYHGSDEIKGEPYGDPARGRIAGTKGKMPAWGTNFGGELTDAEIVATVCHERFKLATADVPTALADEYEHWCTPEGEKWLEVEEGGLAKAGVTTAVG